ncbi:unnamed protein product [Zymoseptoria tritici ST99CH_1A5]|uniref:Uncharacterized protein n=1 Tax=Zymoseptoria tritici ST99CH_1A5 TaxID=1276529 RepID=A0A1Y6LQL7_ZYMTR|nr:unnamed protein product [Zymoseptoria tritici ST99CH_1A5]
MTRSETRPTSVDSVGDLSAGSSLLIDFVFDAKNWYTSTTNAMWLWSGDNEFLAFENSSLASGFVVFKYPCPELADAEPWTSPLALPIQETIALMVLYRLKVAV